MEQDNKSNIGVLEKLALIADGIQNLYKGKSTVVFELEDVEYYRMMDVVGETDREKQQFKIDISGMEFIYLLITNSEEEK